MMMEKRKASPWWNRFTGFLLIAFLCCTCGSNDQEAPFTLLESDQTGLTFENVLKSDTNFNVFNYMYFYNGGGIAAGDYNQDGLVDLYFTGNMGPNRLFLNEGDLQFRDVTEQAGVAGQRGGWSSGATVVDINHDGLLDIYVSQVGTYKVLEGENQLFICQGIQNGIPVFRDEAPKYGLNLAGFGTQATFFDYDRDGDLDMFHLRHSLHHNGTFGRRQVFEDSLHETAGDRLLRNDEGSFTDVTLEAGIRSSVIGYGLGVVTGDINRDGWPDIYVGNDFHENDYLYLNQQDGTFREVLTEQVQHTSRFSMGVDMADINNDGYNEVVSLDMLPDDPFILKSSLAEDDYDIFQFKLRFGYNHQYSRNNLQLNNANGTFSEIGLFAGVYATDWSWAPLLFDFDHDGYKDLFVSNGIPRRMNDIDYIDYRTSSEVRYKIQFDHMSEDDMYIVEKMPRIKLPNRFFRNTGNLRFEDLTGQITNGKETFSNGAVSVDLDNDGDLDLVVNNLEDAPFIYRNNTVEQGSAQGSYLALDLKGTAKNPNGVGATAIVFKGEEQLVYEHYPVRGYQSGMLHHLHLGLGDPKMVDSILLIWPDGTYQQVPKGDYNRTLRLDWKPDLPDFDRTQLLPTNPSALATGWQDQTRESGLDFVHEENPFVEFNREGLIPHMVSAEGPALAVGDIDGNGLEDIFLGGAKRTHSAVYVQKAGGRFFRTEQPALAKDSIYEDVDAQFADTDGDGDLDLIVASGGNEYAGESAPLLPRIYQNDGNGQFVRDTAALPALYLTASSVTVSDIDGDGDPDLFFGGRAVPWNYGHTPPSYLLRNRGDGTFEEVTEELAKGLNRVGLVKNADFFDLDQDGDDDLLLAMEWGPLLMYENENGRFEKQELYPLHGWWNMILPLDYDGDGDMDLIAGNLGWNSKLRASDQEPVRLYVHDFDQNGQVDQILTHYQAGQERPFATYRELTGQMPELKKEFLYAKDFARASLTDLFPRSQLDSAVQLEVTTFASVLLENTGQGAFKATPLTDRLQFSPLRTGVALPRIDSVHSNWFLAGNFYENNIEMGRYDASYGHILQVDTSGRQKLIHPHPMPVKGQVRRIATIRIGERTGYLIAKNNAPVQLLTYTKPPLLTQRD